MKRKNILSLALFAMLLFSSSMSFAQEDEKTANKKKEMIEKLELSEEQQVQIEEITTFHKEKAKEIKANESLSDDEKKSQIKALRDENKAKVEEILTVEQRDQLKELKANHQQAKSSDEKAEAKTKKMAEALDLTESQTEEVLNLNIRTINAIENIRSNESLSDKEKKDQSKSLKEAHKLEMETILNDEQFAKYEEMLSNRKNLKFNKTQNEEEEQK